MDELQVMKRFARKLEALLLELGAIVDPIERERITAYLRSKYGWPRAEDNKV